MRYHRYIIGVLLNKRIFRISSSGGLLVDEILALKDGEAMFGEDYFSQIGMSSNPDDLYVSFTDEEKTNQLTIKSDQVTFKKTAPDDNAAVSPDKAYKEFEELWKKANSILKFPAIRRIGIVAQFRINESKPNSAANDLLEHLVKFDTPEHSGRFHLTYEDRQFKQGGGIPDSENDDYWNIIYTYYSSEKDETPEEGKINANIDVQKYCNPAKSNALGELAKVRKRFVDEKTKFKKQLNEMGFG